MAGHEPNGIYTIGNPVSDAARPRLATGPRAEVLILGDSGYDAARRIWNGAIDKHPALIVRCGGVSDVVEAVRYARAHELPVAVRGGGHNIAGNAVCDGGLVIDLSSMKGIRVDPQARTVRAEGGVTWGELDRETQVFGLATTGGFVSTTGIAGLTLGGGIGWLARAFGLACDNLVAADLVTADGRVLQVYERQHADLFWAIRGGGGNFGVVTSFHYRLHAVGPTVIGGLVLYPIERAADVLRSYRGFMRTAPDVVSAFPALITVPPLPSIPSALHGTLAIAIAVCCIGDLEKAKHLLAPVATFGAPTATVLEPLPYTAVQSSFDASAPYGALNYWKSEYLHDLVDGCVDAFAASALEMGPLSPLTTVHIYPQGGAISRVGKTKVAASHRDARYLVNIVAVWIDAAQSEAHIAWVRRLWQAIQPFSTGSAYVNFMGDEADEGRSRIQAAYGQNYDRLAAVKQRYDPTNFFRLNHNILPRA